MITQERLKEVLHYDPETGEFTWKIALSPRRKVGDSAGGMDALGYIAFMVDSKRYKAHRLAFLYMTGEIPGEVDHINLVKNDNRWCNLRPTTTSKNAFNRNRSIRNTSGVKGVCWDKSRSKWMASLKINGKSKTIGYYPDLIGAELAVRKARIELHGEYANHG